MDDGRIDQSNDDSANERITRIVFADAIIHAFGRDCFAWLHACVQQPGARGE